MPERGFALLIVLWSLVLLSLLGSTITAAGRSEARIATNLVAAANAEAAADGGVAVAAYHLLDDSDRHWAADDQPRHIVIAACDVTVTMQDQRGKIDPNDATSGLLSALLRQVGVPDQIAEPLGSALLDWRVATDSGLGNSYVEAGRLFGPPHEPYQSLDELAMVLGMTEPVMARLRPHLSLYVEQTPALPLADPVVNEAVQDAVRRDQLTLNEDQDAGPLIVVVRASASNHGARFTRTALLRMNGIANQPYEVLDWDGG